MTAPLTVLNRSDANPAGFCVVLAAQAMGESGSVGQDRAPTVRDGQLDRYTRNVYHGRMPTEDRINIVLDAEHREMADRIAKHLGGGSRSQAIRYALEQVAKTLPKEKKDKRTP